MAQAETTKNLKGPRVPAHRKKAAARIGEAIEPGLKIAVTTHVNADGDGIGSEVALVRMLLARGHRAAIANPTPFPERFSFLLEGIENCEKSREAVKYVQRADILIVLDISDIGRLGHLGQMVSELKIPVICIDHHLTDGTLPDGPRLIDSQACATGELVFDLVSTLGWELGPEAARGIYVAILTDTGAFRFSNTSPRALEVAAAMLRVGVEPEKIYEQVFASAPESRVRLLSEVLETLVVEPVGLAWLTVPPGALHRLGASSDDLEGVVEHPRSIRGVKIALLFRQIANGRTKVSFRSVGDVDVARLAAEFGGGGHARAAGASLEGELSEVQERILARTRSYLEPS